ncbi:hypothetical protein M406DRAFT_71842 [Cryphonectria parasitica EP155]|uniref:Uncharacterized protein n=1 Tax=Cryphonectria parasitica (strain ATCC 38755 / EP155) TaxID=660469 RepID=A0A9P5CT80_CRYP1|nr:uncharacterized protein M406DRAFT_71842 [Cryphonectria parasitica EP155]KAF3768875.1 hypothetical protein M406DRAFT_71842 [Cryphonectria parasitica EP155]
MMGFVFSLFLAVCALLSGVLAAPAAAAPSGAAVTSTALASVLASVFPVVPVLPEVSILPIDPIEPADPVTVRPPGAHPPPPWLPIECIPEGPEGKMPMPCYFARHEAARSAPDLEATTPITPAPVPVPTPEPSSSPLPTSPAPEQPTGYDWDARPDWAVGLSDEEWAGLRARLSSMLGGVPVDTATGTNGGAFVLHRDVPSGFPEGMFASILAARQTATTLATVTRTQERGQVETFLAKREDGCAPACGPMMEAGPKHP